MLIDLIIVIVVGLSIFRNWNNGFVRQFWSVLGFAGGIFLGHLLETYTVTIMHTSTGRAIITLITILGVGLVGLTIGEYIGFRFKYSLVLSRFNVIDNGLGSVLSGLTMLVIIWLIASVINGLPANRFQGYIKGSHIISFLNDNLPSADNIIGDLGKLIDPNGFPDVFIGNEPILNGSVNVPSLGSLASAVNADKNSVVRIEGIGCGGIVTGSGFVIGNNLVVTNAHVVAGISSPTVEDVNGKHSATTIWFDPNLDLAVLRTSGLAGPPLKLDLGTIAPGTQGAVLGYPGGGAFNASPAAVVNEFEASGHNIYGTGVTLRSVYAIDANIIPGNSGGPLVEKDGDVIAVVFAKSTTYNDVGYALAMTKVSSEIDQAKTKQAAVSTGQCAE